jgi:succinyl-CoA synthetase alpha subunit
VTPGKGGQEVEGVPVYDTVQERGRRSGPIDVSRSLYPAPIVKPAALEAIAAGVKLLVIVPDRVPIWDVLAIAKAAKESCAHFVGPNTLGVLSPDQGVLGMIGGRAASARAWFRPGPVGITSRSGGMTSSMAYYLGQAGIGATTLVHVGGDAVVGLPHPEVVKLFEQDPDTKAIVIFGEIGGTQEERVADLIESGDVTKPVTAYIGGKAAKSGTRPATPGLSSRAGAAPTKARWTGCARSAPWWWRRSGDVPAATKQVSEVRTVGP